MLIVHNWCIQDPIVLDFFDFHFRYSLYEALVDRLCGVLFLVVAVNNVFTGSLYLPQQFFYGMVLLMIDIKKYFLVCF